MHVLITSFLYYPSVGGNQILSQQLAEYLAHVRCKVTVFTANAEEHSEFFGNCSSGLPEKEMINGVNVRRFKINYFWQKLLLEKANIKGLYRLRKFFLGDSYEILRNGPFIPSMILEISRLKPDIILATNNAQATTYFAYRAHKHFKIPLVILPLTHSALPWTHEPILREMYASADKVITSTIFEKNLLISQEVEEKKLFQIGHGIQVEEFNGADGERFKEKYHIKSKRVVSYIGRMVEGKGVEALIESMNIVRRRFPDTALLLAGQSDVKFEPILQTRLAALSIQDREKTYYISSFPQEDKKDAYAASDIFIMVSNVDSFGLSIMEAWTSTIPVVACKNTPQETMIEEGKDGLLVSYGDKEELAEAIEKLLEDDTNRKTMGSAGRKKVLENYTIDIYGDRIKQELEGLLAARSAH